MERQVADFISRRWSIPQSSFRIRLEQLHGGLESTVVRAHVTAELADYPAPDGLVIKELRDGSTREAAVYDWLWRHLDQPPTLRLLGREFLRDRSYLYLEAGVPFPSWPWADVEVAGTVCRQLGSLHDQATAHGGEFTSDYEGELSRSAALTLDVAQTSRDAAGQRSWRRLGDLRRVVTRLPEIRRRLLSGHTTLIHGDMHPGNVCLRPGGAAMATVLIDWGRARIGSPLEDIASWLHSLGCWEPQARRRHDTLMRMYLESRRAPGTFTRSMRSDYWLASASNGLSGAIRYHLSVLGDPAASETARYHAERALSEWQRVIRRAAAVLSTNRAHCS